MSRGYISVQVDRNVRNVAKNRCGYCLSPQRLVMARLEIEHIIPVSKGGSNEESNLWLACPICNSHKAGKTEEIDPVTGEVVALFNPRHQVWTEHFAWADDGIRVIGQTPTGRATVRALSLDSDFDALAVRSYWVQAGWHPPRE